MSREVRLRIFIVGEEVLHLVDFDDSDEKAMFEIGEEDEVVLAEVLAEGKNGLTSVSVEIVDHQVPTDVPSTSHDSVSEISYASFCWIKRFRHVVDPEESTPKKDAKE